jgi:hypothetical protein
MRRTGDTAASWYGFRRQGEPGTDLCGKDQRGGSATLGEIYFGSGYLVRDTQTTAAIGAIEPSLVASLSAYCCP